MNTAKVNLWKAGLLVIPMTMASYNSAAVTIKAGVDWTLGGVGPATSDTQGPASSGYVDVLSGASDFSGNNIFYHTYGNTTGNFGSRTSGSGFYDITGEFNYSNDFASGSAVTDLMFEFTVIPGQIQAWTNSAYTLAAGESVSASYSLEISLNGSLIWDSSADITKDNSGVTFNDTGTYGIGGILNGNQFYWGSFTETLNLGTFGASDPIVLEYALITTATGNIQNLAGTDCGFTGGGDNGDQGDGFGEPAFVGEVGRTGGAGCGGSIGQIGDPFGILPEPATLFLMGLGLAGIAAGRRR